MNKVWREDDSFEKQVFCPNCGWRSIVLDWVALGKEEYILELKCPICKMIINFFRYSNCQDRYMNITLH